LFIEVFSVLICLIFNKTAISKLIFQIYRIDISCYYYRKGTNEKDHNKPSLHIYDTCSKITYVQFRFQNFLPKSLHIQLHVYTETKKFNKKRKILDFVILEVNISSKNDFNILADYTI
jgi:hypothetical protein